MKSQMDYLDKIIVGDCLDVLKGLPEDSFDSIVTDPPYGISFMSKIWDYDVPKKETWEAAIRVLKPGGHALIFGGTRTFHRLVVEIEDAGFEIRDTIAWHYAEGFPKNMNISKQIDKQAGAERETIKQSSNGCGNTTKSIHKEKGFATSREKEFNITAPSTEDAKKWNGWGTALKPATELICLARKPISEKTIAENVLNHGTGGINIDGARVGDEEMPEVKRGNSVNTSFMSGGKTGERVGRWPSNCILDKYTAEIMDGQEDGVSRFFYVAKPAKSEKNNLCENIEVKQTTDGRQKDIDNAYQRGKTLRNNFHPTCKPVKLLQYLINLITPPGGIVLDPYFGSGSTGIAAKESGFNFTGIELNPDYAKIAEARLRQGYLF